MILALGNRHTEKYAQDVRIVFGVHNIKGKRGVYAEPNLIFVLVFGIRNNGAYDRFMHTHRTRIQVQV